MPSLLKHHDADGQIVAADRLHLHAEKPNALSPSIASTGFPSPPRRDGEAHADAHHAPGPDISRLRG